MAGNELLTADVRSRSEELTREDKAELVSLIEFWANQRPGGLPGLPDGLYELRNALHDDLHDARKREKRA